VGFCIIRVFSVLGGYKEEQTGKWPEALHRNKLPPSSPIKMEVVFPPKRCYVAKYIVL
jgi:hypothetical protein